MFLHNGKKRPSTHAELVLCFDALVHTPTSLSPASTQWTIYTDSSTAVRELHHTYVQPICPINPGYTERLSLPSSRVMPPVQQPPQASWRVAPKDEVFSVLCPINSDVPFLPGSCRAGHRRTLSECGAALCSKTYASCTFSLVARATAAHQVFYHRYVVHTLAPFSCIHSGIRCIFVCYTVPYNVWHTFAIKNRKLHIVIR